MCSIKFNPIDHTYRRVADGMLYMPVTHFSRLFKPDFKGDHHAKKKAAEKCIGSKKYKELYDAWCADNVSHTLMPEYIPYLEQHIPHWPSYEQEVVRVLQGYQDKKVKGAEKGTQLHDWKEKSAYMRGFELNEEDNIEYPTRRHGKQEDGTNKNVVENLRDLEWGFYSELMIWYNFPEPVFSESMDEEICGVCGQSDRVFIDEWRCFDLSDWKSSKNKKLDDFGTRYKNYGFEMMLFPFEKFRNHDKNNYNLQLSVYMWMLKRHGLTPNSGTILHKEEKIPVTYWDDLVSTSMSMVFSTGM